MRRALLEHAKRRPLRWLAEPLYELLVTQELRSFERRDVPIACRLDDVTALVKTFERPAALDRLLASLRRVYPRLSVLVVDDGREAAPVRHPGCRVLRLAYDVGVSAGRNAGVHAIDTPFVLVMDDDFVLTSECGLERVVDALRAHTQLDVVGGQVFTLPTFRPDVGPENARVFGGWPGRPPVVGGLPTFDRISNFFLARTRRIAEVGWDPRLKLMEHTDFFRRALGRLVTAFDARFGCLHATTPFDDAYMRHRHDTGWYVAYLAMKWRRGVEVPEIRR